VVWNLSMILTMLLFRHLDADRLIVYLAWGTVLGCLLQFLVQLGPVLKLVPGMKLRLDLRDTHVKQVGGSFLGVAIGRGVVQISAFVDQAISTLLGSGAIAGMTTASSINLLPVSLFGMAISASELPTLSRMASDELDADIAGKLSARLNNGLERIAFFIVPSAMAFFALGNVVVAALYQSGAFTAKDSYYVWAILAGSGVGLLATTFGRLYSSTYYALRDTRTPLRFAIVRLMFTVLLGLASALLLPRLLGIPMQWGAVGLTASAGVAGWIEFHLLRRKLNKKLGPTGVSIAMMGKLWVAAGLAALAACVVEHFVPGYGPIITAMMVLSVYGVAYFAITYLLRIKVCVDVLGKILRRAGLH
jgi:putative peptidoglycan lipid II flippase